MSEEDSELEVELTPDKLMELAAESEEGELYWEWLVETGRVQKSDEELKGEVEEKKDEENVGKGKEAEVEVWVLMSSCHQNSFCFYDSFLYLSFNMEPFCLGCNE